MSNLNYGCTMNMVLVSVMYMPGKHELPIQ